MNIIGKFISNFKDFYNEINAATLTGAIDVVVVRQEDGSYLSSPFHVRFGKMGVLRSREKVVDIEINGEPVDIHMKLGETGEAFFVQDLDDDVEDETITEQNYAKSDEEARSQDSGFEAEDNIPESQPPSQTLTLRLKTDVHGDVDPLQEDESDVRVSIATDFSELSDAAECASADAVNVVTSTGDDTSQVSVPPCENEGDDQSNYSKVTEENRSNQSSELGVISRVPRQNSSKFVMKHICTQTDCDELELVPVGSEGSKKASPKRADAEKGFSSSSLFDSGARHKNGKKGSIESNNKNGAKNDADSKSKEDVDDGSKVSRNQRRKRRRRQNYKQQQQQQQQQLSGSSTSGGKKKSGSGSQSSDASTTSEVADLASVSSSAKEDGRVFAIDHLDAKVDQEAGSTTPMRKISCAELGPSFHPFSDTDISPPPSPGNSRPGTPIKSDTEYEVERHRQERSDQCATGSSNDNWNWTWGQLPTPPAKPHAKGSASTTSSTTATPSPTTVASSSTVSCSSAEQRTETSPAAVQAAAGGLQDAPVAADASSKSADLTQSGAQADSDMGEAQRSMFGGMLSFMRATKKARHNPQSEGIYLEDLNPDDLDPEVAALYFPKFSPAAGGTAGVKVPGSQGKREDDAESGNGPSLPHSPHSSGDPRLLGLELEGEQDGAVGGHPVFDYKGYDDVALSLCGRLQELRDKEVPESLFLQSLVSYDDFCCNPSALLANPDLVVRMGGAYYNWATAAPQLLALVLYQRPLPPVLSEELAEAHLPKKEPRKRSPSMGLSWFGWRRAAPDTGGRAPTPTMGADAKEEDTVEVTAAQTQTTSPGTPEKDAYEAPLTASPGHKSDLSPKHARNYKKSLRLTSDQIERLKLHDGSNEVMFSVTTAYQGTTRCNCRIYLWNYDEKIIVSDIDGTITKSDVLGHILPIIGRDWAQGGVAQLFSKIKDNGYHFLYLSARAIGQARITRDYLESVVQEDIALPDGPLLLNPTSLLQAFHREVIERKPEEFKISCLRDIQALFPKTGNPFYAGYGNRVNDVWAYCAVGIPISRVFTINHKGELKHELTQTFQSTYEQLGALVDDIFPPTEARTREHFHRPFHSSTATPPKEETDISSTTTTVSYAPQNLQPDMSNSTAMTVSLVTMSGVNEEVDPLLSGDGCSSHCVDVCSPSDGDMHASDFLWQISPATPGACPNSDEESIFCREENVGAQLECGQDGCQAIGTCDGCCACEGSEITSGCCKNEREDSGVFYEDFQKSQLRRSVSSPQGGSSPSLTHSEDYGVLRGCSFSERLMQERFSREGVNPLSIPDSVLSSSAPLPSSPHSCKSLDLPWWEVPVTTSRSASPAPGIISRSYNLLSSSLWPLLSRSLSNLNIYNSSNDASSLADSSSSPFSRRNLSTNANQLTQNWSRSHEHSLDKYDSNDHVSRRSSCAHVNRNPFLSPDPRHRSCSPSPSANLTNSRFSNSSKLSLNTNSAVSSSLPNSPCRSRTSSFSDSSRPPYFSDHCNGGLSSRDSSVFSSSMDYRRLAIINRMPELPYGPVDPCRPRSSSSCRPECSSSLDSDSSSVSRLCRPPSSCGESVSITVSEAVVVPAANGYSRDRDDETSSLYVSRSCSSEDRSLACNRQPEEYDFNENVRSCRRYDSVGSYGGDCSSDDSDLSYDTDDGEVDDTRLSEIEPSLRFAA